MNNEEIYKSRSFLSCMNAAYKLIGDNLANIFRKLLLPIFALSICSATMSIVQTRNMSDFASGSISAVSITIFYTALAAAIFCSIWMTARLFALLNGMPVRKNLARVSLAFAYNILIVAVISVIAALCVYCAYRYSGVGIQFFITNNWLVLLLAVLALCIFMLPLIYVNMHYINSPQASFWRDFPRMYATGLRHLGTLFITALLVGIILFVIFSIACMPLFILNTAQTTSLLGELIGDPSDLPGSFSLLMFFTCLMTSMFVNFVNVYPNVVYFLLYGSIEKQREEFRIETKGNIPVSDTPELPMVKL